ncbi:hypothetical protein BURKHO8Y_460011 [Burkholderia sp. 8Y]|nr:hypothetical protein BURKHO8Y_460011 [Burkholderia sp. 8Y]
MKATMPVAVLSAEQWELMICIGRRAALQIGCGHRLTVHRFTVQRFRVAMRFMKRR